MAKTLEIEFKGGRKAFVSNDMEFPCVVGDLVIVQAEKGEDLGRIVNMGYLVDQRAGDQNLPKLLRKPSGDDLKQSVENAELEEQAVNDCALRIEEHGLDMKLVDGEYQFDRKKITFYFTSEKRVDFRALVRDLAAKYRTRIELRQIGVRDEAKRIGGVGVCGRRLCCTAFLREFAPVTTQFAKDQNLALNPTKLSGACGRLMCCLLYERDFYQEAIKEFPQIGTIIQTEKGAVRLSKVDIFKENAVLQYENGDEEILSLEALQELLQSTKKKKNKRRGGMKNKKKRKEGPSVE
ncbi:stage 0 sporulation family protein [candidate division KSB1 bacterium]|nr:stage 0 sporulation family protein [candidate division KSB1 bacterium]